VTAATEASEPSSDFPREDNAPKRHVLTAMQVLTPESLAIYPNRIGTDRANAYPHSGAYGSLASGLPVFSSSACANTSPSVSGPANEIVSEELLKQVTHPPNAGESPLANEPGTANKVAAPGCTKQGPFTFNGEISEFPHAAYKEK
jgi:phospholipid/cholesterol/gamma-HCH transport system substrate-binding protein